MVSFEQTLTFITHGVALDSIHLLKKLNGFKMSQEAVFLYWMRGNRSKNATNAALNMHHS